jgi:hypothetical protein
LLARRKSCRMARSSVRRCREVAGLACRARDPAGSADASRLPRRAAIVAGMQHRWPTGRASCPTDDWPEPLLEHQRVGRQPARAVRSPASGRNLPAAAALSRIFEDIVGVRLCPSLSLRSLLIEARRLAGPWHCERRAAISCESRANSRGSLLHRARSDSGQLGCRRSPTNRRRDESLAHWLIFSADGRSRVYYGRAAAQSSCSGGLANTTEVSIWRSGTVQ